MGRVLLLIVLAALLPAADAAAATCRSGFPVHEEAGIRLFIAETPDRFNAIWGCTTRVRSPRRIWETSPSVQLYGSTGLQYGSRLALEVEEAGEGGNGLWAGWFDVRSGRSAFERISGPKRPVDPDFDNESWTPSPVWLAVAPDGSLGFAFAAFEKTYELFTMPFDGRKFGRQAAVVTLAEADFEPLSLRITGSELRWRTRGAAASVALGERPAMRTARRGKRPAGVRCSDGEGVRLTSHHRVFRTSRGLFACADEERARPVTLGGPRAKLRRASSNRHMLAYVVRDGARETIGVLDARSSRVRSRRRDDDGSVLDLDVRDRSGIAYVVRTSTGRAVRYLAFAGTGLADPAELADMPAVGIEPRTIRVEKASVQWRAVGEPRTAALP